MIKKICKKYNPNVKNLFNTLNYTTKTITEIDECENYYREFRKVKTEVIAFDNEKDVRKMFEEIKTHLVSYFLFK